MAVVKSRVVWVGDLGMHVEVSGSSQEQGCVGGGPGDACGGEWQ